jgi:hypothetical protein
MCITLMLRRAVVGTRTVRLDQEAEETLQEIKQATGLSISAVLKRGLLAFRKEMARKPTRTPYEIYRELDLGPGGYASAPSTETRRGVKKAIERKLQR